MASPRSIVIPLLRRTELNASYLGATGTRTLTLPTVPVLQFYYATLALRVHEAAWQTSATVAKIKIEGFAAYPTPEDAREFLETSASLSAEITGSATLPGVVDSTVSDLAMAYKFILTMTQGSTAQNQYFVVASADLILRCV